jgi:GNAT superfamily N-acetyltransferase
MSVAEPWQGKGLAKLMLTKLERRAAAAGIRRIIGETLVTNEKMLSLEHKGWICDLRQSAGCDAA